MGIINLHVQVQDCHLFKSRNMRKRTFGPVLPTNIQSVCALAYFTEWFYNNFVKFSQTLNKQSLLKSLLWWFLQNSLFHFYNVENENIPPIQTMNKIALILHK